MYSAEDRLRIQNAVCDGIASGLSLRKICKADSSLPTKECIRLWLRDDAEFFAHYTRAREARADARADRIDEITEAVEAGTLDHNQARVMIDAEKWQAGKENSKRYGDKIQVEGDLTHRIPDEHVKSRIAKLLGKAGTPISFGASGEEEGEA